MSKHADIAIIGAGAAGLTCAIFAAQTLRERGHSGSVVLLDSARVLGAKILVAGGGRCNVTNERVTPKDFSAPPRILRHVLGAWSQPQTVAWFESLGVTLKREPTGKLFPVTDEARTVLDALLRRCRELGIEILTEHRVVALDRLPHQDQTNQAQDFYVHHTRGVLQARRLILSTGGRSLPRTGSDGSGWELVQKLGHTVTPQYPALVPLVLAPQFFHASLSGLTHDAQLTTFVSHKRADRRSGSLLFTHFGISGPVVMDASRYWTMAKAQGLPVRMECNLLPGMDFAKLDALLVEMAAKFGRSSVGAVLEDHLPRRLTQALLAHVQLPVDATMAQLSRDARRALVHAVVELELPVVQDRGWNYAEVTAGGVPVTEVDVPTMASKKCDGLYLAGEILDCDGRIGGFNFQWAWSTGHIAGCAAAKSL